VSSLNKPSTFDCMKKVQTNRDLPYFLLLASDPLAADLVNEWAFRAKLAGVNKAKVAEAERCAIDMADYHHKNRPTETKE